MAIEIERKFLIEPVHFTALKNTGVGPIVINQFYLDDTGDWTIRARSCEDRYYEFQNFLTMKRPISGMSCVEIETNIEIEAFEQMVENASRGLSKSRYTLYYAPDNIEWEIDFFHGRYEGVVVAEIELESEDQELIIPEWCGEEVTNDPRYRCSNMAYEGCTLLRFDDAPK